MNGRHKIAIVVLAAGQSLRMGDANKLLVAFDGKTMIERTLGSVVAAGADEVVVVTGHQQEELCAALEGFAVRFVHNPDYREGLSTSLKTCVREVNADVDGVLVVLGDMPLVEPDALKQITGSFAGAASICVPVYQGRQGNPVLWGRDYFDEILNLDGDHGAKKLLKNYKEQVIEVNVKTGGVLRDFDLPSDLSSL